MTRTYEIETEQGRQTVTLAQFRAILDERKAAASLVMAAFKRGDLEGCAKAQADMRAKFGG